MEAQVVVKRQPYMPDSARAAMPNSPLQPLPAYLREEFQQCLDRDRPHELINQVVNGKVRNPQRCAHLHYRYLDNNETVMVPNAWYNQTQAMRVAHWEWQVQVGDEAVEAARKQLAWVKQFSDQKTFMGTPIAIALRRAEGDVELRLRLLGERKAVLEDVKAGTRLV